MGKHVNLKDKRVGKLTVIGRKGKDKWGNKLWVCQCDCGGKSLVPTYRLTAGKTKSCGCIKPSGGPRRSPTKRFWEKVTKDGQQVDYVDGRCWEWTARKRDGYGKFWNDGHIQAHRYAWELFNGPVPNDESGDPLCVLHKCDNRACVRPSHLFVGTKSDNSLDMYAKGRESTNSTGRGANNISAKLTSEDVIEIRRLYETGNYSQDFLGEQFGVSGSNISYIVSRKTWNWI